MTIDLEKAAEILGTSVAYVRQLINRGHLDAIRQGRRVFLDEAACRTYKERHPRLGEQCTS